MRLEPIVTSLLDTDLYKFNMDQVIFHKHTNLSGEYDFRCRNEGVVFTPEMLEEINALGIGPGGLGGKTTALAVHIAQTPTHIAGLPVAVNVQCHAMRHQEVVL